MGFLFSLTWRYSSSGLGLATVQDLLASNAYVSILDLHPPPPLSSPDTSERPRFIFLRTDITDGKQVQQAVDHTVAWTTETGAELGGVINSAGIGKSEFVSSCQRHILRGGIHNCVPGC